MIFRTIDPIVRQLEHLGLGRAAATRLSRSGTAVDIEAGKLLCREGERGSQAFLLLEGEAQVRVDGRVIVVGPGDIVGELATLDPHRTRNATVTTSTPVRVLVFDVGTFRYLAQQDDLRARLAPDRVAA